MHDAQRIEIATIASPLGEWISARYRPLATDTLARTLTAAWYFDGVLTHARERVFPKGVHGLIVQLDEPHRRPGGAHFPAVVYNGIATRAVVVEAPAGRTRVLGLEFAPTAGFAFAGRDVAETTDEDLDLASIAGDEAHALFEACSRARGAANVLLAAARWCTARVQRSPECDPSVGAAVERIARSRGNVRMRELAAEIGRGERALERAFRDRIGLVPKRFARIARFKHAHALLASERFAFAEIADRAGYYDQAHFNADYREHAGLAPTAYLSSLRYPGPGAIAEPTNPLAVS